MTEEELQTLRLMMREEIGTAIQASEQRMRTTMREEIGTAVQASEQRAGERLEKLEARVARMDGRVDQLDQTQRHLHDELASFQVEMRLGLMDFAGNIREDFKNFKADVRKDLESFRAEWRQDLASFRAEHQQDRNEVHSMLDDITTAINDLRTDQHNLENKFDDNTLALRRDMQTLAENMQELKEYMRGAAREFLEMNRLAHQRLSYHENTPIGETHPRPPQPGTAA
jgi:chromosome segregation ATPase